MRGAHPLPVPLPGRYGINYAPGEKMRVSTLPRNGKTRYSPAQDLISACRPYEAVGSRLLAGAGAMLVGAYRGRAKTAKVPSSCTRENPSPERVLERG